MKLLVKASALFGLGSIGILIFGATLQGRVVDPSGFAANDAIEIFVTAPLLALIFPLYYKALQQAARAYNMTYTIK